jgi:hypothetical protein
MTSQEYAAICRTARQAYFAWQNASGDQFKPAIEAYEAASAALKKAQEKGA